MLKQITIKIMYLLVLMSVFFPACHVYSADIGEMEDSLAKDLQIQDSLHVMRDSLVLEADALSVRISGLKTVDNVQAATGALREALRRTLAISSSIEAIDQHLESTGVAIQRARDELRLEYDDQVAGLINQLAKGHSDSLVQRLILVQKAKDSMIVEPTESTERFEVAISIRESDGPDEIRQKAEFLADLAAQARSEASIAADRVLRLSEERRLRSRVTSFSRELSLFDETLPEGRSISTQSREDAGPDASSEVTGIAGDTEELSAPGDRTPSFGEDSLPAFGPSTEGSGEEVVTGREIFAADEGGLPENLQRDEISVEIDSLKAYQSELLAKEQAFLRQMEAFQARIMEMLGEDRP